MRGRGRKMNEVDPGRWMRGGEKMNGRESRERKMGGRGEREKYVCEGERELEGRISEREEGMEEDGLKTEREEK